MFNSLHLQQRLRQIFELIPGNSVRKECHGEGQEKDTGPSAALVSMSQNFFPRH